MNKIRILKYVELWKVTGSRKGHEVTRSKNDLRCFFLFMSDQWVMHFPIMYSSPRFCQAIAEKKKRFLLTDSRWPQKSSDPYLMTHVTLKPKIHWYVIVCIGKRVCQIRAKSEGSWWTIWNFVGDFSWNWPVAPQFRSSFFCVKLLNRRDTEIINWLFVSNFDECKHFILNSKVSENDLPQALTDWLWRQIDVTRYGHVTIVPTHQRQWSVSISDGFYLLLVDFSDFQIFVLFSVVWLEDPGFKLHSEVTTKYKSS